MEGLENYNLDIARLKNQEYQYQYQINQNFFQLFENSPVQTGDLKVILSLRKSETMIELQFDIEGLIQLICDRSLEKFNHPVSLEDKLILKFGDHNEIVTEELEIISKHTVQINLAQYIYEFIGLSVPMKKLHPKFQQTEEALDSEEEEESTFIYNSETGYQENSEDHEEKPSDPRWQALKKFKD